MSTELEIIKKDEYLNKFISDHNLNDEFLNANLNKFLRVYESRLKCSDCNGILACKQCSKGQRLSLSYEGVVFEEIEYCKYGLAQQKKNNLAKSYVYCDVVDSLIDVDLNNIEYTDDQKQLYLKLAAILHNKTDKGLYISGDLGTGKTYLCVALANSLVANKQRVAFVKVANFFNEMKSYVGNKSELIDKNINSLQKVDYLILDDIGSESVSEFVRDDILFRILDYRLENKLTTIFTSNLNKEDLLKHYQYDRKDKSNLMNAKRLVERIDILTDDYVLTGKNMRRYK